MPGVDVAMGTVTVPIWMAGGLSAVFVAAIILAISRVGAVAAIATLFRVAVVVVAVVGGWIYMQRSAHDERAAERRMLDERSAALMARAIAPGSALSCLDEVGGETVEAACERAVFSSPEAVAAAVNYVAAKLNLLIDGTDHAQRVDPSFAAELVPIRTALELDRFGILAHVLMQRDGCTVDQCDTLSWLQEPSQVQAHLRDHSFDGEITRYAASWNAAGLRMMAVEPRAVLATAPPAAGMATQAPGTVSPRYDFPGSQSIPQVNIMAPEGGRPSPAGGGQAGIPVDANAQAATPVPPRRPPQTRSTARPVPAARSEPPAAPADLPPDLPSPAPRAAVPGPIQR